MSFQGDACAIAYGNATQSGILSDYLVASQTLRIPITRDTVTPQRRTSPEQDEDQVVPVWELAYRYGASGAPQIVGANLSRPWVAGVTDQFGAVGEVQDSGFAVTVGTNGRTTCRATLPAAGPLYISEYVLQASVTGGDITNLVTPVSQPGTGAGQRSAGINLNQALPVIAVVVGPGGAGDFSLDPSGATINLQPGIYQIPTASVPASLDGGVTIGTNFAQPHEIWLYFNCIEQEVV